MFLFENDSSSLSFSLSRSMGFLYKDSDKPFKHWVELIPFTIPYFINDWLGLPEVF